MVRAVMMTEKDGGGRELSGVSNPLQALSK